MTICATKSIWDSFPLKSQKNPSCIEIKSKSPENLCKKEFFSKELNSKDFQHEPSIFTFHPKGDFSNYEQKKELEKQTVFDKILKNIIQNEPRKFIFNPKISNEVYTEHIKQILNGLKKAKHILNPPSLEYQKKNSIKLNSKSFIFYIFLKILIFFLQVVAKLYFLNYKTF